MGWFTDFFSDPLGTIGEVFQTVIDVTVDAIGEVVTWFVDIPDAADLEEKYKGILANVQSNIASIPVIYGQRKVGGNRVFVATSGTDNNYLYMVMALCEGQVYSIGDVYINDKLSTDAQFSGLLSISKYTGTDTQTANNMFRSAGIGWTSAHRLRGVAYLAIRFKWDQDAFGGIPTVHAVVQGRKVYDPRTSATATVANSSNPALCLRDYLTNARYGKSLATDFIDDTLFIAAANKCDNLVASYPGSANQKIFEANAVIDTSKTLINNVKVLLSSMRGLMPYQQGKYGLIVEDQGSSSFGFDESHIIGGISIRSESKKTKFNRIIATFPNPAANWQMDQIEYPVAGSAEETGYLAEDGGVELVKSMDLACTTNIYTAQDIAEIALKRSRNALTVSFNATSEALNVAIGDIVSVTHSTPAWSAKPFRVQKLGLNADGTVSVSLAEHQDSIYPWSSKTQAQDIPDTNLPNPFSVVAPSPTAVDEELYTTVNSKGIQSRATFKWDAPADAFVVEYEAGYKLTSASVYKTIGITGDLEIYIDDIKPGQYDFRVRSINSLKVRSSWAYLTNRNIAGLTAVPADITNFNIRALDGQCHVSWTRSTDLDVINGGFVRVRHSELITNATWDDGTDLQSISGSSSYQVLPLLKGTYMAKFVDSGGRFSTNAKFSTTTVPNIMQFNVVETITESTSYAGTKTNMEVDTNLLIMSDAGGGVALSGLYYFSNAIDLGAVYTSRLSAILKSSAYVADDLFDSRTSLIDTWQNFDGEPSNNISAHIELRQTADNPASSPTWSDWATFLVGDYHARAYQFRLVATSSDATLNIAVEELKVIVDMPDRIENAHNLTAPAAGKSVTFAAPFKAIPAVGITMQNGNSGDYFRITNTAATGFDVRCFTAAAAGVERTINWQAAGYGRGE